MPLTREQLKQFRDHFDNLQRDEDAPKKLRRQAPAMGHCIVDTSAGFNAFVNDLASKDNDNARERLSKIDVTDVQLLPFARRLLAFEDPAHRTIACRVLERIAHLDALDELIKVAEDEAEDRGVRNSASRALLAIYRVNQADA